MAHLLIVTFAECTSLTSVTIPAGVNSIGEFAFSNNSSLAEVQFLGNAPTSSRTSFKDSSYSLKFYYLSGNTGFTNPWNGYKTVKTGIEVTAPPAKVNYAVGESLDLNGLVVTGYYRDETSGTIPVSPLKIKGFDSSVPAAGQVVTVEVNGKTASFTVNIVPKSYVVSFNSNGGSTVASQSVEDGKKAGVSLDKTSINLKAGDSAVLTAAISPADASNRNVTWASSNTSVAAVDNKGKVTAAGKGTATITVTTKYGKFYRQLHHNRKRC